MAENSKEAVPLDELLATYTGDDYHQRCMVERLLRHDVLKALEEFNARQAENQGVKLRGFELVEANLALIQFCGECNASILRAHDFVNETVPWSVRLQRRFAA